MLDLTRDILRLLDANMNRAVEGIRVMEDTARMLIDDRDLTSSLKALRHDLVSSIKDEHDLNMLLLESRGSERDVLREGETESERSREDVVAVARANARRAQEAVRVLEEYVKLVIPSLSERFKTLRFRLYDLEKELVLALTAHRRADRKHLGLYVFVDVKENKKHSCADLTREAVECGAGTVALIDRRSTDADFLAAAGDAVEICRGKNVNTVVSGRLDCALILAADGVHLESCDIPVRTCRSYAGPGLLIGYGVSAGMAADAAAAEGSNYIVVDFSEIGDVNKRMKTLVRIAGQSRAPVVVTGGITPDTASRYIENGATGIAVDTSVLSLDDIIKIGSVISNMG